MAPAKIVSASLALFYKNKSFAAGKFAHLRSAAALIVDIEQNVLTAACLTSVFFFPYFVEANSVMTTATP